MNQTEILELENTLRKLKNPIDKYTERKFHETKRFLSTALTDQERMKPCIRSAERKKLPIENN